MVTNQLKLTYNIISLHQPILDLIPGDVYWKNIQGTVLGINAWCKNTLLNMGFDADHLVGKKDFDIFDTKTATRFRQNDLYVMQTGQSLAVEEPMITAYGDTRTNLSIKTPIYDEEGENVVGILGHTIDITKRQGAADRVRSKDSPGFLAYLQSSIN